METFTKLFGSLLLFVYHCFDRVVMHGYLSGLSRPGQVVHFFQQVVGEPVIGKEFSRGGSLIERDDKRYAYRLTGKRFKVALTFVLFHHRVCGPLANSLFHDSPHSGTPPNSKLEAAYHKADASIRDVIQQLEAA
jgi:hypothetical protein